MNHTERSIEKRLEAELENTAFPFRRRIDIIWGLVVLCVSILLVFGWLIGVLAGNKWGIFDKPIIQPVKDTRILVNVRDDIQTKPLLDAVPTETSGLVFISQTGGKVHGYNPAAGLWFTEKPFDEDLKDQILKGEIVELSSHVGDGALWGFTAGNGLVRRTGSGWEVVKGDTAFIGARGKTVKSNDLSCAAVSNDGQWLAVGTKADGVGIYHTRSHRWLKLQRLFYNFFPSQSVTHIVWCDNRFWVGGPKGIVSVELQDQKPYAAVWDRFDGSVMDMDADPEGRLWILEKRDCRGGGGNCQRLSVINLQEEGEPLEVLLNQQNVFSNLSLDDMDYAQYWDDHAVLCGSTGVYSYDAKLHNWERLFWGDVSTILPLVNDTGFYFGYSGGIGAVSPDPVPPWETSDKRSPTWYLPGSTANDNIIRMDFGLDYKNGSKREVLALGLSGVLFSLDPNRDKPNTSLKTIFKAERTVLNPGQFMTAAAFGNNVLFTTGGTGGSSQRVLLHNIVTRSYNDIGIDTLPAWLRKPGTTIIESGERLFAAVPGDQGVDVFLLPSIGAVESGFLGARKIGTVPGTFSHAFAFRDNNLLLVTNTGLNKGPGPGMNTQVFRFDTAPDRLIGPKAPPTMNDRPVLLDACPAPGGLGAGAGELHPRRWRPRRQDGGDRVRARQRPPGRLSLPGIRQGRQGRARHRHGRPGGLGGAADRGGLFPEHDRALLHRDER